jgi:hypothetical protein
MKSPQPRWVLPSALCAVALAAVVLASISPADADVLTGRIYLLGDRGGQPLFTWQFERDVVGSTWRSSYRTPAGDLSAADELIWDGDVFKSYRYERPTTGEIARVDRQGQEVVSEQRVGGITRRNRERFAGILMAIGSGGAGLTAGSTVIARWFEARRGLAIGIAGAAISVGQLGIIPLVAVLALHQG